MKIANESELNNRIGWFDFALLEKRTQIVFQRDISVSFSCKTEKKSITIPSKFNKKMNYLSVKEMERRRLEEDKGPTC